MLIQRIETVRTAEFPNVIHVRVHTDEGIVGLGETSFGAAAVEAYIHESAAQCLLGRNPLDIERHWTALNGFVGFNSTGAEMRGRSAIDIALWDILGKVCGQPVHVVLGGASRDRLRVYNTCAGYRYVRAAGPGGRLPVSNWGVDSNQGPYEDLEGFLHRPAELARSLLDQGITAMKIWPFDPYAESNDGHGISDADLAGGCEPLRRIRDAVGSDMEIMLELHSMWDVPTAARIADAVEEFRPSWLEDPIRMDSVAALQRFAAQTSIPIVASETLGTRWSYQELIDSGAVSIVMVDPVWTGGLTEARKIAAMADTAHLPVTPHDCLGPVQFTAAWHLAMHAPNTLILESVRAFYTGWYRELVTFVPEVRDGHVGLPTAPGLGTELLPSVLQRPDAIVRVSDLGSPA